MKHTKWIFTILLAVLCALPAAAQYNASSKKQARQKKAQQKIEAAVERTVATAQTATRANTPCSCRCWQITEDEQASLSAEMDLQRLRDSRSPDQPDLAPQEEQRYLEERYQFHRGNCPCGCHTAPAPSQPAAAGEPVQPADELDIEELIAAEEELSHIRNTRDTRATFKKYPYLLDPAYRRGTAAVQQTTRQNFHATQAKNQAAQEEEEDDGYFFLFHGKTWKRKVGL